MSRTRHRRAYRFGIVAVLALVLMQALFPGVASMAPRARDDAMVVSQSEQPPCDRIAMPAGAHASCCGEDAPDGALPCGDPARCEGVCGLLRSAVPLPAALVVHVPSLSPLRNAEPLRIAHRPAAAAPPLRPPISV